MNKNIIIAILIVIIIAMGAVFLLGSSNAKVDTQIKIINNETFQNGEQVQFQLTDAQGNALSGQSVNITFDNDKNSLTTDQNGKGYLSINGESAGKYDFEVTYAGNDKYNGCSAKETITITDDGADNVVTETTSNATVNSNPDVGTNSSTGGGSSNGSSSNLVYDSVYMVWYDPNTGIIPDGEWGGKSISEYRTFIDGAADPNNIPEELK